MPEDSGINYPLLGFLMLACPLRLLPPSYTFISFSSAASTIYTSFRPHLLFTRITSPSSADPTSTIAGWRKKAKPKEYGVPSSSSANTRPRHAPGNQTQAGLARETPRSPLTSPTRTSAGTNKESHQPSFTATVSAQDLVTTKEESLHELGGV